MAYYKITHFTAYYITILFCRFYFDNKPTVIYNYRYSNRNWKLSYSLPIYYIIFKIDTITVNINNPVHKY